MAKITRREVFGVPSRSDAKALHIASLLVQARPEAHEAVQSAAQRLGADVHATANPCKFAVVLEASSESALADATHALYAVPGVLTVSIVAHLTDDAAATGA